MGVSVSLAGAPASHAGNTVTVSLPTQRLIVPNSSSTPIVGASVSDSGGSSQNLLMNITLTNIGSTSDYLSIDTSTVSGISAAYPYTGSNFANFTVLSFLGTVANVNTILGSTRFKFNKGSTGTSGVLPSIAITATEMPAASTIAYNSVNGHYYQYIAYSGITVSATCTSYSSTSTCIKDKTQTEAFKFADAYTFAGKTGYLVSITSASENLFVQNQIGSGVQNVWIGATDKNTVSGTSIGGEGIWQWMGTNSPEYQLTFGHVGVADSGCSITFADPTHANHNYQASADNCGGTGGTSSYSVTTWVDDTSTGNGVSSNGYSNWCSGEPNNSDGSTGENSAVTNWNGNTRNGSSCWNDLYDTNNNSVAGFVIEYGDVGSPGNFSGSSSSTSAKVFLNPVFSITAGNNQSATVDSQVATVPQVQLKDEVGNVVTGTPTVTWAVTGGGGVLGATTSTINAVTGYATPTSWTMGTNKGTDTITATLSDTATSTVLTFVALAIGVKQSTVTMSSGATTAGLTFALSASGGTTATAFIFSTSSPNCSITGTTLTTNFSTSSYTCLVTATRPGGTHYQDETATATITLAASVNGLAYPTVLNNVAGNTVWEDPSPLATGGTGAITYSISPSPGNITNRITINSSTGRVTVNPTALATDGGTYTITATDTLGDTQTTTLPIIFLTGCSVTTSTSGGITVETVTSGTDCGIFLPNSKTHFLVVGGGGQGGGGRGGGGGAGGVVYNNFLPQAGSVYQVTVGTGGQANSGSRGANGSESYVILNGSKVIVAGGGGGGGALSTDTATVGNGANAPALTATPTFSAQGSGGGGGTNFNNGTNYYTTGGTGFKNGGDSYKCINNVNNANDHMRTNGGGGGAAANGSGGGTNCATQNLANVAAPNGGSGLAYAISGASTFYAGGGGGSDGRGDGITECQNYYSTLKGTGGSGVGGNGSQYCVVYDTSTTTGIGYVAETAAVANTGSGGGATLRSFTTPGYAGYGASGIAIFRFITQSPQILSITCDTSTALFANDTLTTDATFKETLTATMGSSSASLLNRVYQWQYRTSAASNTWINTGYNSLVETFTAGTGVFLNGAQLRLAVTDSDTVDVSSDTLSATTYSNIITLTVNPLPTFTTSKPSISYTYGSGLTNNINRTIQNGTAPFVITNAFSSTPNANQVTIDTSTSLLSIFETLTSRAFNYGANGIIIETITVKDAIGYTYLETITITVTRVSTLNLQADTLTALTYSLDSVTVIATNSATGLVTGDTYTVGAYKYQQARAKTCAEGGICNIGDTGPAGGKVFAILSSNFEQAESGITSGGKYLEAAPADLSGTYVWCSGPANFSSSSNATSLGFGSYGTYWAITEGCTGGAAYTAANYSVNSYSDWFMPTRDELIEMLTTSNKALLGLSSNSYWSSSKSAAGNSQAYKVDGSTGVASLIDSTTALLIRPIRTFYPDLTLTFVGSPTSTPPTNAGTYQISIDTPTVTFGSGSITNYNPVNYLTGQVIINKATLSYLRANDSVTALTWPYGTSLNLFAKSPTSETSTVTFTVSNAPGSTCSLSNVTTTSAILSGTNASGIAVCYLYLTKPATANFNLKVGDTTTVTFTTFAQIFNIPTFAGGGNMAIAIGGPNTETSTATNDASKSAKVNSIVNQVGSTTIRAGDTITLTGNYFIGVNLIQFLGGGSDVTISPAVSNTNTFTFTLPMDVLSGPMILLKPAVNGRGTLNGRYNLTITP